MLVRYFRRPSRIEQLRSSTGGHLLEGFAKELSQGRYQWVAARKHIRAAEHFLHWIAHRNLSIASVEERYAQQFLDHLKRCCCRGHRSLRSFMRQACRNRRLQTRCGSDIAHDVFTGPDSCPHQYQRLGSRLQLQRHAPGESSGT
jgi:hypothetical protein